MALQTPIDIALRLKDQASRPLQSALRGIGTQAAATGRAVGRVVSVFGALGATLSVGALSMGLKRTIDHLDNLAKSADRVGLSTDSFQKLAYAADLAGVSQSQLEKGMTRFTAELGKARQGTGELRRTLEQYKISLEDTGGRARSVEAVLGDLADASQRAGSAQDRAAIANQAFGRGAANMALLLRDGSAGIQAMGDEAERLGLVFEERLLRNAEAARDELTRLGRVVSARVTVAFAEAVPVVRMLLEELRDWGASHGLDDWGRRSANAVVTFAETAVRAFSLLRQSWTGTRAALSGMEAFGNRLVANMAGIEERMWRLFGNETLAQRAAGVQQTALLDQAEALIAMSDALEELADSEARFAELRERIAGLRSRPTLDVRPRPAGGGIGPELEREKELWEVRARIREEGWAAHQKTREQWLAYDEAWAAAQLQREAGLAEDLTAIRAREALEESRRREELRRGDWVDGAREAWQRYADLATDYNAQVRDMVGSMFTGMETALSTFVIRGKASFKDFANSVISDLIRIAIRSQIVGPLAQSMGLTAGYFSAASPAMAMGGAVAHAGGVLGADRFPVRSVPESIFADARRYHGGGVIGAGEVPVIAKRGEGVFTPAQMRAMGGPKVEVNVINQSGAQVETRERTGADGRVITDVIVGAVARDIAQGGQTWQAMAQAGGLRRAGRVS